MNERLTVKTHKNAEGGTFDQEQTKVDLKSPDADVRRKAVRALCPCHAGWEIFQQNLDLVARLLKDPSPCVRADARHVFQDAGEMQSEGLPTNPREMFNEMLRTKRASRFRPDAPTTVERRPRPHERRAPRQRARCTRA